MKTNMSAPLGHAFRRWCIKNKHFVSNYQLTVWRNYARKLWHSRQPMSVAVDGEVIENRYHQTQKKKPVSDRPVSDGPPRGNETPTADAAKAQSFHFQKKMPFKLPDDVVYERIDEGDRRFGPLVMNAKSRKLRNKDGFVLLEGKRLIEEAIQCRLNIKSLYFDRLEVLEGLPFKEFETSYYKVTSSHMKVWSDLSTPPGLMALCEQPTNEKVSSLQSEVLPVTVVCDNIRDPGNMGTILRTAVAVGCQRVIAPKGCVDMWDTKVLRAASGAHFRCPTVCNIGWEAVGHYLPGDTSVYLADNAEGETWNSQTQASKTVMEAIASIEPNTYTEKDAQTGEMIETDGTFLYRKIVDLFRSAPLGLQSLFEVNFTPTGHVTVIIGGETEGLSPYAKKLCFDKAGERLFIPMTGNAESLNAGVALSVVLFELKRQILKAQSIAEVEEANSSSA